MTLIRLAAASAAALSCACFAQSSPFTDDDRALLTRRPVVQATVDRAAALGKAESLEALDYLVAQGKLDLVRMYVAGFTGSPKPNPEANAAIQQRIVWAWDQPWVGELLKAPRTIDNKRLTELMLEDVTALARLRAERRRECIIQVFALHRGPVAGDMPTYGAYALKPNKPVLVEIGHQTRLSGQAFSKVEWRVACSRPNPAEPATDLDGKPRTEIVLSQNPRISFVAPRRDLESARAIVRATAPGIDAKLAPLLADLWLPTPVAWDQVGKPKEPIAFPPLQAPREILYFLRKQKVTPGPAAIAPVLAAYEGQVPPVWGSDDGKYDVNALLELAVQDGSAQGMQLVAHWLPLIAASPDRSSREFMLASFVWKVGAAPPGQVDLAAVKRETLGAMAYEDISKYSFMFDQAQRSRREAVNAPAVR